ncbi:lipase secretion chaperone [Janthinobacterium fluminis]|uniref:Lipase helper protein n=1 Tax=Janthinobacterium fluminis TaxID=2987524 RepID=A0ABT5JUZ5_9BURK|nr:lipase secretion chaperone [Janthinobacterium fluminis]MDC8756560.1 lipase secretion chaperone [Janthinobacterium fluminis]
MRTNATIFRLAVLAGAVGVLYITLAQPEAAPPLPPAEADHFAFVPSMAGTRPDGELRVDAADGLVVDAELGHLFDYYLAGLGEKSMAEVRGGIERELERRLKPAPAAAAKRLLGHYLDYKRALVGVEQALPRTGDLARAARARMEAMRQLRPSYFSAAETAGLFGASDARDADALARLEIGQDPSLDAAQKQQKLAQLELRLSPALREEREAPARILHIEESVRNMRAQGAGDNEVYRARAAALSPAAADRLAELDRDEAAWQSRIDAYLAQRAAGMDAAALQRLRDAHFKPDEQRRLGAYE